MKSVSPIETFLCSARKLNILANCTNITWTEQVETISISLLHRELTYRNDPSWILWKSFDVCYPIPSTKLEINRPIGEQLLLYLKRDLNSNRGSEKIGGIFSSSVVRSHRVSICSGNEITIGRLPSRLCKGRVLSSNSASWNANSWYRRHNRFQILDSPGRQGTCWRNWFARDQIRGSYLSFFLFLLVRKQDV